MTANRLEIIDLGCARGDRVLFGGINEQIRAGELLHIVGSNGSGKTTLLRTLCGLSRPAAGEVRWRATPIGKLGDEYRADLAYLGHKDGIHGELTPAENLRALTCASRFEARGRDDEGGFFGRRLMAERDIEGALERWGVAPYSSFPSKILSQGQKRRVALARLLLHAKPLWILDEPYAALDAASCRLLTDILAAHLACGGIAVLASHQSIGVRAATIKCIDLDVLRAGGVLAGSPLDAAPAAVSSARPTA